MPTDSSYPRLDIPKVNIWKCLFWNKHRTFPDDKLIYRDAVTGRTYTYAQVKTRAILFGTGLKSAWKWKKGDVLALFTPNSIDMPAVIWGALWAGGVVTTANPAYTVHELSFQLKDAGAKALVTQKPFLNVATEAAKKVGIPQDRIILIGDAKDETKRFKHFSAVRKPAGTPRYRRPYVEPKALAFLVYSSGTTGHPKGVMLTHSNIVSNIYQLKAGEGDNISWNGGRDNQGDQLLGFLPFFHIYGLNCLLHQSLFSGWTLTVMPAFNIETFLSAIQTHHITFAYVVPPVVLLLAKHPSVAKYDLSSLRMLNCGAAPLTADLVHAVYNRIGVPIKQGYGLSETSPTTHIQPWELWDKTIGSVGTLLPNQTAKYMDEEGREVEAGQTGELGIKGPNVFKGYLNNPEGTSNALTEDGFFKTGDVGHQDKDGNFYITDRVKELIKYKGFQVAPAELEGLLTGHSAINDVAVVGVFDKSQATEVPRAYVMLKDGVKEGEESAAEIVQWLAERVAGHKRLRGGVRFVDEIPKSASGKILRRVLKLRANKEGEEGGKAKL